MKRAAIAAIGLAFILSGCATGTNPSASLPRGQEAYAAIAAPADEGPARDYRIGAHDTIGVAVFQEPELSVEKAQVDAAGNITLPLIGTVAAAGKTAGELSALIEQRLGAKYLEDPQVTVSVGGSVSQKVTVQGEVNQAGVYEIKGRTSLLEALAMAKGESKVASLKEVVVFRQLGGQRMGAVFDVASIRRGDAPDPEILGNDVVVVGYSHARSIWRDVLTSSPLLGLFRPF